MPSPFRRRIPYALVLVLCAGCGDSAPPRATVKGRIMVQNKALDWGSSSPLEIILRSPSSGRDAGESFAAAVAADGAFVFKGDVPLRPYKITVRSTAYGPDKGKPLPVSLKDLDNPEKTPLSYRITDPGEHRIVVDIGKKTVEREK